MGVETATEITALNLADTNTSGTVTGSVQTTATLAKTCGEFGHEVLP